MFLVAITSPLHVADQQFTSFLDPFVFLRRRLDHCHDDDDLAVISFLGIGLERAHLPTQVAPCLAPEGADERDLFALVAVEMRDVLVVDLQCRSQRISLSSHWPLDADAVRRAAHGFIGR